MPELMLMRHAKSDWTYSLPDLERPLNKRGRNDALAMGEYLEHSGTMPDRIIVSPAQRTRETADLLLHAAKNLPELIIDNELYLAGRETLLELAEAYSDKNRRLMLLAHNPGMDETVSYLSSKRPALSASGKLMTTCAVAIFSFDSPDDLHAPHRCMLNTLLRPEDIRGG